MGTGKTPTTIRAMAESPQRDWVIVCPASLKLNWKREIEKWWPNHPPIQMHKGRGVKRMYRGISIINYDVLVGLRPTEFFGLICDESHYIKTPGAKRSRAVYRLVKKAESNWFLTGTPILNNAIDLYQTCRLMHPYFEKWSRFQFGLTYTQSHNSPFGWKFSGVKNERSLLKLLKEFSSRVTKDRVLDLPAKHRIHVPLSTENLEQGVLKHLEDQERMLKTKNFKLTKEVKDELATSRRELGESKVKDAVNFIKVVLENEKPVLVFAHHKSVIKGIVESLKGDITWAKITGDTTMSQRQDFVDEFQYGVYNVLVCNIKAAGVGLTLTKAKTAIFVEQDWTPANNLQAEDRIHRIGQESKCTIYYLNYENSIDDYISKVNYEKESGIKKLFS